MKKNLLIALALVATGIFSASAQDDVFLSTGAERPYRIPAIATLKDGSLLAISDYRPCYKDVGNGEVDMYAKVGTMDAAGNYSWSGEAKLIADGKDDCGYGDAALVVDRESGDALVICVSGKVVYGSGSSTTHNGMSRIVRSADGLSWETPQDVTTAFFDNLLPSAYTMFMASGRMLQSNIVKAEGAEYYRIYGALLVDGSEGEGNYVVYSDDFGNSWNLLGDGMCVKGGNEAKLEELPNGDIVISSRANGGRIFNVFNFTNLQTAEGNWEGQPDEVYNFEGNVASASGKSGCNGELLFYKGLVNVNDGKTYNVMLQSLPAGTSGNEKRSNVTVFYKAFEADKTSWAVSDFTSGWAKGLEVDGGESAYSTMTILPNGNIGFLYESEEVKFTYKTIGSFIPIPVTANAYGYNIKFRDLTVNEITGDAYKNPAYSVNLNECTIDGESKALATFSAPVSTRCPEGVAAYYIKAMNNGYAKLEAVEEGKTIPADAGVMLMADAAGSYTMTGVGEFADAALTDNMLVGSSNGTVTFGGGVEGYILKGDGQGGVAFYKATGTLGKNKAYLNLDSAELSAGVRITIDGTTAIEDVVEVQGAEDVIYDLYGRRVSEMLPGNIYIVGGKKVLR